MSTRMSRNHIRDNANKIRATINSITTLRDAMNTVAQSNQESVDHHPFKITTHYPPTARTKGTNARPAEVHNRCPFSRSLLIAAPPSAA